MKDFLFDPKSLFEVSFDVEFEFESSSLKSDCPGWISIPFFLRSSRSIARLINFVLERSVSAAVATLAEPGRFEMLVLAKSRGERSTLSFSLTVGVALLVLMNIFRSRGVVEPVVVLETERVSFESNCTLLSSSNGVFCDDDFFRRLGLG